MGVFWGEHFDEARHTGIIFPLEAATHKAAGTIGSDHRFGVEGSFFGGHFYVIFVGDDVCNSFALPHGDAKGFGRFYQPMVKFITPHNAENGIAKEGIALIFIKQAYFANFKIFGLKR